MSIDHYEPAPNFERPKGLDIKVEKSETGEMWTLSFVAEDEKQRDAYKQAFDITMKMNAFHSEASPTDNSMEDKWEISGIPEGTEAEDFQSIINDIQDRANTILSEKKLAA